MHSNEKVSRRYAELFHSFTITRSNEAEFNLLCSSDIVYTNVVYGVVAVSAECTSSVARGEKNIVSLYQQCRLKCVRQNALKAPARAIAKTHLRLKCGNWNGDGTRVAYAHALRRANFSCSRDFAECRIATHALLCGKQSANHEHSNISVWNEQHTNRLRDFAFKPSSFYALRLCRTNGWRSRDSWTCYKRVLRNSEKSRTTISDWTGKSMAKQNAPKHPSAALAISSSLSFILKMNGVERFATTFVYESLWCVNSCCCYKHIGLVMKVKAFAIITSLPDFQHLHFIV